MISTGFKNIASVFYFVVIICTYQKHRALFIGRDAENTCCYIVQINERGNLIVGIAFWSIMIVKKKKDVVEKTQTDPQLTTESLLILPKNYGFHKTAKKIKKEKGDIQFVYNIIKGYER